MNYIIKEFTNMVANIVLFSFIPFVWYVISKRKVKGFFASIGLHSCKPQDKYTPLIFIGTYIFSLTILISSIYLFQTSRDVSILNKLNSPILIWIYLLIYGLKTGVAEEILFRGFIAKKLFEIFNFRVGNIVQALIFALPHIISISVMNWIDTTIRIANAFVIGIVFGYVMEKKSNKSIVPCMTAHIIYNMVSSFILYVFLK